MAFSMSAAPLAQSKGFSAPSVLAVGGQSSGDVAGDKMMLGIPVDVPSLYSTLIAVCKNQAQLYLKGLDWLSPVPPSAFSQIDFRFRTTKQYGTDKDSGLSGAVFSVYEPSWAMMAEAGRKPLSGCKTDAWDEGKDAVGGYPWPGAEAIAKNSYRTYKEANVAASGVEKAEKSEAGLTDMPFLSYHIRKQT